LTTRVPEIVPQKTYRAYILQGTAIVSAADLVDPTKNNVNSSLVDVAGNYITVTADGNTPLNFKLKDGQRLVFTDLPVGTAYSVNEAGTPNYKPSCVVFTASATGVAIGTGSEAAGDPLATGWQLVAELDPAISGIMNRAAYDNYRGDITPTGIDINDLPFIGMIAIALIVGVGYVLNRSRRVAAIS